MNTVIRGKVWTFGDNVNSESIMATGTDFDPAKAAKTSLCHYDKEFPTKVKPGDIIVAGRNFGCSSSRPAARALKFLGVAAILCESSGAIFYRNTWNIGVPILECPGISKMFNKGDEAEVDVSTGFIKNLTTGATVQAEKPIPLLLERWAAGGMIEWVKSRRDQYDTLK
ncbi:MAG TPA: 3-isopropylmalate dehydratase [Clostridiales bacterium]|jgi:3-isopropylmalate/(R)-2-methylmalate dehydratase small subunit|nr:3-isopropylmalate dehydratase [Clostridiales bacterium]